MTRPPVPAWHWGVVWFFFAATLLNYADRVALGSTVSYLLPEFGDTETEQKVVYADANAAFGLAYALGQLAAGFVIDRVSLRWVYAFAILIWSAAGAATGFVPAGAVGALIACRIGLGAGEAFNWPGAIAGIRRLIPRDSRGLANGIFHGGATLGAILTPIFVLAVVNPETGEGWRNVFVAIGAVGGVVATLWLLFTRSPRGQTIDAVPPADADPGTGTGRDPSLVEVLTGRLFWLCLAAGCGVNLAWHLTNIWFPIHLKGDLRVRPELLLYLYAGFFLAADIGSIGAGWSARALARNGLRVGRARQLVMTALAAGSAASGFALTQIPNTELALKMLAFAVLAASTVGGFSVFFALMQDVSRRHTAKIVGICGFGAWVLISLANRLLGQLPGGGVPAWLFPAAGCTPIIAAIATWCWPVKRTG